MLFPRFLKLALVVGMAAAVAAAADDSPAPKFTPLSQDSFPDFLAGAWVADQLPYADAQDTPYLSTLVFTNASYELTGSQFGWEDAETGETNPRGNKYLRHVVTSWQCIDPAELEDSDALTGAVLLITEGVVAYGDGTEDEPAERCWVLVPSEDGTTMKEVTSRAVDSQSSEEGPFNTNCPGRLHGGAINFPIEYKLAGTYRKEAFENPCLA